MVYTFKLMICIAKMSNISCQMSGCSCGDNMVRISRLDCARALGMVQAGTSQEVVARHFNVNWSTISRLLSRYRDTADVKDRPRSGRPRVTAANTDRRIVGIAARCRFVTANTIQAEV